MPRSLNPHDLKESYICLSIDVSFAMFRHRQTILLLEKLQNLWDFQTLPYHDWSAAPIGKLVQRVSKGLIYFCKGASLLILDKHGIA